MEEDTEAVETRCEALARRGAPEVQETYARALELCGRLGEAPQLFPVLMGLQAYYAWAGELPRAHELVDAFVERRTCTS